MHRIIPSHLASLAVAAVLLAGCEAPQESHRTIDSQRVQGAYSPYAGARVPLAIGKVWNKSKYMSGIFSEGKDQLGMQARHILKTHLTDTGRFAVMERANLDELARESQLAGQVAQLRAGEYVITGGVTEFGRRDVGTVGLGGIVSRSRAQQVYTKVQFSVVDVRTGQVLHAVQGAGEYQLKNEHVLGFGSEASYDATLTDRVLNLAVIEAVQKLTALVDSGHWSGQGG